MKAQVRGEIGSRRAARENALELGYEQEMRGLSSEELFATLVAPADDLTVQLLVDAEKHRSQADELIAGASDHWDLHRMALMDLTLLRIAVAELIEAKTPTGVVIAEAVYLTGLFSAEESSRFVNGLLGAISRQLPTSGADPLA